MADGAVTSQPELDPASTGPVERFEPDRLKGELVEAEHLVRYYWAAGAVSGREVLDLGCGAGYGCEILTAIGKARRCVGVDVAEEAIDQARAEHGPGERVEYVQGDAASLPFEGDSFDVVTCFETIEHVKDAAAVVSEAARVLRPGGLLLISSPNRDQYPPGNPFHVREFTPAELTELLSAGFPEVRLLRQHNWMVSAVLDDGAFESSDAATPLDLEVSKLQGRHGGEELYTIAACSDRPFDAPALRALVTHGIEVRRWLKEIAELLKLGDELARTREALAARERELLELRDKRSTAMGELERQAYWLQRAEIDPEALVKRPPVRAAFRAFRLIRRIRRRLRRS
jgi:SAM-dependent methyltransferase